MDEVALGQTEASGYGPSESQFTAVVVVPPPPPPPTADGEGGGGGGTTLPGRDGKYVLC